jgi:YebC/PmpR family DNA-binding regulatory protein
VSGHSKWATIKRQKGVTDAKRSAVFTKIANQIAIAARSGADPLTNPTLAMAIEKAKAANMPGSNVERAIQRVTDKNTTQLQEVLYEGYGPGGVGILVECATDNLNRTYPEVKHAFSKHGGSIAEKGAVAFQFTRRGIITVQAQGDEAVMQLLEAGADDVSEADDILIAYTDPKKLAEVKEAIAALGLIVSDASIGYTPNSLIEIADEDVAQKVMRLMDALDELQDVSETYTNFEVA